MPQVTFIEFDGTEHTVDVDAGKTLMQAALDNGIDSILAECGGCCSCATCHCYVDDAWTSKVGEAGEDEKEMLEGVLDPKDNSRLSCQITLTDELDGLVVSLPESQF